MDILAFSSCFGMMSCWGKQKKTQIYFSKKKIHIRHIWGHPLQNIWQLYGENILQEQYNMWGAHGAKMSTCCTPHSPPSSCSPKEAKLWSANAHCCQCYHLFINIHPGDMSKQLFSDLQYVRSGILIIHILRKISHDPLLDNLFYNVSCDLSFWHWSYSLRACLMSLRICIVCLELYVW